MSHLRPYQSTIVDALFQQWHAGQRNVLIESATGTGKTVMMAAAIKRANVPTAVVAHRAELVSQISTAMAREGVRHRIVGADALRKTCVALHMREVGRSFYDPNASAGVCSVLTLDGLDPKKDAWFSRVQAWSQDECHHVQKTNAWGRACEKFPNAYGMGWTATPRRADGRGLGAHNDGVFHAHVRGPSMREQINAGYLTGYRVFTVPSDVDYSEVTVTASGDLSPAKLRAAVHASDKIVGDVVREYRKVCMATLGRLGLGVTFAVDVEAAQEIARAFNADGVPAEVVSAKTPDVLRANVLERFARGEVMQLVNVDLFGEGFDLPAIEVVSFVRKTESWPLYVQQFGRVLRLMVGKEHTPKWGTYSDSERLELIRTSRKPFGIIIDHVGNVIRHGLPDKPMAYDLERRSARSVSASDAIPMRTCVNQNVNGVEGLLCGRDYERFLPKCPFCGFKPEPPARSEPKHVDGDLYELDPATLAAMRGEVIDLIAAPTIPRGLPYPAQAGFAKNHLEAVKAQAHLRDAISLWSGWQRALGRSDPEIYRLFFLTYGLDMLSAQALRRADADNLLTRVVATLSTNLVTAA